MNLNSHTGNNSTGDLTVHPRDETNLANVYSINNVNKNNKNFGTCDKTLYNLVNKIAVVLNEEYILDTSSKNPLDPNKINGRLTQEDKQLLFNELKNILKCKLTKKVIVNISKFANTINELQNLTKIHGDKNSDPKIQFKEQQKLRRLIPKYNNMLNIFKNYIRKSYDSNTHNFTKLKIEMLNSLRMLCHDSSLKFKDNTFNQLNINEIITENKNVINTNRLNYDGLPILPEEHKIVFTIPETIRNKEGTKSNGVLFGFSENLEFKSFLNCAIDEATPDQLLCEEYFDFSNNVFGSVIVEGYIFSINLNVKHGFKVGKINTTSSKIMHWLTNNELKESHITSDKLLSFNYPGLVEYDITVKKKIYQSINQKHNDPEFPLRTIQCYRPNCQHYNIYKKGVNQQGNLLKCTNCRISEFCKLCEKPYHGNTPCDITVDEQTEIWINDNTKACPNPKCKKRIQKNEGCNHMTCKQCSTHFCWLCNQIYTHNDVNNHYRERNPYGGCINQIQLNNQGNHIQDQGNHIQDQGNHIQDQGNDIHQNDEDDDDDVPELEEFFGDLPILEHIDMHMPLNVYDRINLVNIQDLERMIALHLERNIALRLEHNIDIIEENDMEDIRAEFRRNIR